MDFKPTQRGFMRCDFKDACGVECSLQESSIATDEGHIWFGCDEHGLKMFIPNGNPSWRDVGLNTLLPEADYFSWNGRMHLSQSDVQKLLPALQYFAENGELPSTPPEPK